MKKLKLCLYDIVLCEFDQDSIFSIQEHKENISKAKDIYPLEMRFYKKTDSKLLYPIEMYLNVIEREDVVQQTNINESDDLFEKLYKAAALDFQPINGFTIKQA